MTTTDDITLDQIFSVRIQKSDQITYDNTPTELKRSDFNAPELYSSYLRLGPKTSKLYCTLINNAKRTGVPLESIVMRVPTRFHDSLGLTKGRFYFYLNQISNAGLITIKGGRRISSIVFNTQPHGAD